MLRENNIQWPYIKYFVAASYQLFIVLGCEGEFRNLALTSMIEN